MSYKFLLWAWGYPGHLCMYCSYFVEYILFCLLPCPWPSYYSSQLYLIGVSSSRVPSENRNFRFARILVKWLSSRRVLSELNDFKGIKCQENLNMKEIRKTETFIIKHIGKNNHDIYYGSSHVVSWTKLLFFKSINFHNSNLHLKKLIKYYLFWPFSGAF